MRVKRLVQAVVVAITLIVGVIVVAIVTTQTTWFKNWLRGYIVREAHQYLNGDVSIGRLGGNLFFGIELEDVGIALNGRPVISVKDIGLRYNSLEFLRKGLSVQSIRIDRPVVYLQREGEGWSIARLVKKDAQEANRQGPGRPITIEGIGVSAGSVVFEQPFHPSGLAIPTRIDDIDARLAFRYEPVHYSIDVAHVSFRGRNPDLAVNDLSAGVSVRDDEIDISTLTLRTSESSLSLDGAVRDYLTNPSLKMQLASDKISLPEIGRIVPSLASIRLQPAFELRVDGRLDRLSATGNVRSSAGDVSGQVIADLQAPDQSARGELTVQHLNLAPITGRPDDKSDVTAVIKPDLHAASFSDTDSLRGTVDIDAPRGVAVGYTVERVKARATLAGRHVGLDGAADAYGAAATFKGSVTLGKETQAIAFNLNGGLRRVNLAKMPRQLNLPLTETDFNGSYHVSGTGVASLRGDVRLADSEVAGAHIASGSTVAFSVKNTAGAPPQVDYQADVTASNVDVQRIGRAFAIKALDNDRYKTVLNVRAQASGRGTSPVSMEATICGELTDSTLLGGRVPQLAFDATLGHDAVRVKAAGSVADLDPSVASERAQAKGDIAGSLDVDATITNLSGGLDPDHINGTAKVSLSPSQVGGLRVDRGSVDAQYQRQTIDLRTLDVTGPDLRLQASGTIDLAPDGASNLKVHADSSNLPELGKLVNQPLTGIATVDAIVTGNRTNLKVTGNLTGDDVSYGSSGALTLSTQYSVDVPNLSVADATVSATTDGTFVTVGGQHINELTAKTQYEHSQLDVDLTARQSQRSMSATGTVLFHPDEQELRLTRLDLSEQGLQWHLDPESEASIRYGSGVTKVKDFRLASGNQQIVADGTFGKSGEGQEPLSITVKNVDLSSVDVLLLRPPQFSGVLNASGTVSGPADALQAKGDFEVTQGGFRGFRYESFKGTAAFNGKGVTIDSRLQQNATAWLRASGYVPATAFRAPAADEAARGASSPDDRFDLHIESTPVDLGIIQGFTTALTNVTGQAQATLQVTGAGDDPRPSGTIAFTNGAFKVDATGVPYTGLTGRIELQDDRVHIASLDVYDNASSTLSLTGDIPIRRALTGDISLQITARDFKVLDNKMGNLRIDSDLTVAGELRALRIEGDLAISTGTINLDPVLAATGGEAYATKPAEYLPAAPRAAAQSEPAEDQTPGFAGVRMNVHVTVPNDLVVKSSDLRTSAAPIGLGAVNVTLGGDLRATKDPNQTIQLAGTVNAVRGSYQFQSRQFTILRDGLVRFNGDPIDQLNPTLDVKTQRIIQGVQANADIRGTLQRPRIELTSVPPLERADILSLIVFNQPVNQLGEGQQISLNQRAEQLALGSIAGELSKSLGSLLNVSEFQIQAAPDSGAAAQLTVGQQVSQNLFVKLEQGIGDVTTTNLVLEYELKSWLRLQTNVVQAVAAQQALFQAVRDSGFDLIFMFTR